MFRLWIIEVFCQIKFNLMDSSTGLSHTQAWQPMTHSDIGSGSWKRKKCQPRFCLNLFGLKLICEWNVPSHSLSIHKWTSSGSFISQKTYQIYIWVLLMTGKLINLSFLFFFCVSRVHLAIKINQLRNQVQANNRRLEL